MTDPVEAPEPHLDYLTWSALGEQVDGDLYQALADLLHTWLVTKEGTHGVGTFLDLLALTEWQITRKPTVMALDELLPQALDEVKRHADERGRYDDIELDVLTRTRDRGATWQQIAETLGVTEQAAQQRYQRLVERTVTDDVDPTATPPG